MRQRIWLSPCPSVALEAVVLKKVLCFAKVLYRDIDSKCRVKWEPFSLDTLIERP